MPRFPALILAACLIACLAGCGDRPAKPSTAEADVRRNLEMIRDIPQDGITLGELDAPATLTVYASLDDFSVRFFTRDLPRILPEFVRPGRLRLQVRTADQTLFGEPSDRGAVAAASVAQAVGLQDHLWQFYGALSARYVGEVDDDLLDAALADVRGIDLAQVDRDAKSARVAYALVKSNRYARQARAAGLPHYVLEVAGKAPRSLDGSCPGCLERSLVRSLGS